MLRWREAAKLMHYCRQIVLVFFLVTLFGLCRSELHGDNVCTGEQLKDEIILVKQEQKVLLTTYERCLDIRQGFKCKVQREGTKVHYKETPKKTTEKVLQCCYGYYPTENETCIACEEGFFGFNCTQECRNCTEEEICHHRFGCCNPTTEGCGLPRSELFQHVQRSENQWMIPVLIASICVAAILLLGLIFYRKKYMKEKDPDLPTLTYHPHAKGYAPPVDEYREFNNPLYRQSAVEIAAKAEAGYADLKNRGPVREEAPQNEYATLDEVSEVTSPGPSSRVPLMHDAIPRCGMHADAFHTLLLTGFSNEVGFLLGACCIGVVVEVREGAFFVAEHLGTLSSSYKYEVPYRPVPSPECRVNENEENLKKEST
ncbi:unnamed protein product [Enterobius vermicularis]|uniref:EMI domain-containing protein n=1 Tax=Enterobius vermicularis TaxID=51028 RepID=A0A0N4VD30_ENTVE|nr:unnamed protein product [Enterobius vermicularis]